MRNTLVRVGLLLVQPIMGFGIVRFNSQGIDDLGNCWIALENQSGANNFIQAAYIPFGSVIQSTETISDIQYYSENPRISMNANGDAILVWITYNDDLQRRFLFASTLVSGKAWSVPFCLSLEDENVGSEFKVDISSNGNVSVAWNSRLDSGIDICSIRTGNIQGNWYKNSRLGC